MSKATFSFIDLAVLYDYNVSALIFNAGWTVPTALNIHPGHCSLRALSRLQQNCSCCLGRWFLSVGSGIRIGLPTDFSVSSLYDGPDMTFQVDEWHTSGVRIRDHASQDMHINCTLHINRYTLLIDLFIYFGSFYIHQVFLTNIYCNYDLPVVCNCKLVTDCGMSLHIYIFGLTSTLQWQKWNTTINCGSLIMNGKYELADGA